MLLTKEFPAFIFEEVIHPFIDFHRWVEFEKTYSKCWWDRPPGLQTREQALYEMFVGLFISVFTLWVKWKIGHDSNHRWQLINGSTVSLPDFIVKKWMDLFLIFLTFAALISLSFQFNLAIKDILDVSHEAKKALSGQLPGIGRSMCVEISLKTSEVNLLSTCLFRSILILQAFYTRDRRIWIF